MSNKTCPVCNKIFPKPSYVSRKVWKTRIYCSHKCYGVSLEGTQGYWLNKHRPAETLKKMSKGWFKKGDVGKKCINWKGGISKISGRYFIKKNNHPFSTKAGYVRRYRLVAEKCLGRYLTRDEVIHHINGIKDDDRPENLYLFSNSEHTKFHFSKNKIKLQSNIS